MFLTLPSVDHGFNALPNQTDTLLYQITLEAETDKHVAGYFEYRPNPVIGDIASGGISIVRLSLRIVSTTLEANNNASQRFFKCLFRTFFSDWKNMKYSFVKMHSKLDVSAKSTM